MSRLATPSRRTARQAGQSLVSAILITSVVAMLATASLMWAKASSGQAAHSTRSDIATQAAEAGIQQYVSRIIESRRYWGLYVDPAEDPRISTSSGMQVNPGQPWANGDRWTYSGASTTWKSLQDARFGNASYSLRVYPLNGGTALRGNTAGLRVQSTARVQTSANAEPVYTSVVAAISPLSLSDFQMVSDVSITYGSTATTNGQIYSNQNISHNGVARANLYARNWVCRDPDGTCNGSNASYFGALAFDKTTTPSFAQRIKSPIDFSQFAYDRSQFKQAAQTAGLGLYMNDPTARGWMLQFTGSNTLTIWKLTSGTYVNLEDALPTLECPTTYTLRGGNLENYLYFEQPVVIGNGTSVPTKCDSTPRTRDSVVDGRVTIATSASVYVGGNITYKDPASDVLGLMAANDVVMTRYAPTNLKWVGATLAETGQWRTAASAPNNSKGSLTFTGSIATKDGGYASMFSTRNYQWDENLAVTGAPPMFPEIDGTWDVLDWRKADPPS